ncbi:MAG: hypothetical protein R2729_02095 [Bryobacteraceae bacterium]
MHSTQIHKQDPPNRLARVNAALLDDAEALIGTLDESAYGTIGGQIRHIVEFYECFFEGLAGRCVDYDARRRDPSIEKSRLTARGRIAALRVRLEEVPRIDMEILVRAEDSAMNEFPDPPLRSSAGRELQSLASHTVHHFAVIALLLRSLGIQTRDGFGVAPSTLRHREAQSARSEAA